MSKVKPIEIFFSCRTVTVVNGKNETVNSANTRGFDTVEESEKFLESAYQNLERVTIMGLACDNPEHTVRLSSKLDHLEKQYRRK